MSVSVQCNETPVMTVRYFGGSRIWIMVSTNFLLNTADRVPLVTLGRPCVHDMYRGGGFLYVSVRNSRSCSCCHKTG